MKMKRKETPPSTIPEMTDIDKVYALLEELVYIKNHLSEDKTVSVMQLVRIQEIEAGLKTLGYLI